MLIDEIIRPDDGLIEVSRLVERLHVTRDEVAAASRRSRSRLSR